MPAYRRTLPLAAAILLVVVPASAQKSAVETQVWIDVATHSMAGMPDLGMLGGLAGRMLGDRDVPQGYPRSRGLPATTGKVLDIAMHNSLRPGVAAEQFVPAGLQVGRSLPLVPPLAPPGRDTPEPVTVEDMEVTVRQYWGCGATIRPGQPKTITLRIRRGQLETSGSIAPNLFVPDRDIDVDPRYALWPNMKNSKRVSDRSSMVGQHRISGDGVPESLQFDLGPAADFMPRIALETQGGLADAIQLGWQPVDRARAYFVNGMAMQDERNFVVWSSAEVAGAGQDLVNYLTGSYIDRWLGQKVLLPASTTRCTIPQGIFKSTRADGEGMASVNMIAYGPETNITWPPRPADPKAPWDPEWNVRVRTKSTTMAMLGVDMGDMGGMDGMPNETDETSDEPPTEEEGKGRKLLRGLLRSF
ncbi:hypothetical protein [Luteimonas saliphila]|uniref:hypothetical protein n=1 Tax=Luteimonas saliphila TaxID=2804919 RepID=UPI00192D6352|nr:hypothetical protein [Luteimonas saliphila]